MKLRNGIARSAHSGLSLGLALGLAGFPLLAGCSKAPKPRAEVPAAEAGTRTAAQDSSATGSGSDSTGTRTGSPPVTPHARRTTAPAAKPAADSVAKNGANVSDVQVGSSTSSPAVVPQITAAEQERLERETKAALEQAQKLFEAVDSTKLDADKNRKYVIAKDFLAQAGAARGRKEYERAQALALKARLLAEEIAPH